MRFENDLVSRRIIKCDGTCQKELEHQLTFYENCFPWLVLFKQLSVENALWVTELAETRGLIDDSAMLELMEPYLPQNDQEFKS